MVIKYKKKCPGCGYFVSNTEFNYSAAVCNKCRGINEEKKK